MLAYVGHEQSNLKTQLSLWNNKPSDVKTVHFDLSSS